MAGRPRHGSYRSSSQSEDDGNSSMDNGPSSLDSGLSIHSNQQQQEAHFLVNEVVDRNWGHINAAAAAFTSWPSTKHWFLRQLELGLDMETMLRPHLHHLCESTINVAKMMSIFYAKYDLTEEQGVDLVRHHPTYDLCYSLYYIAIMNNDGGKLLDAWERSDNHRIVQYLRTNSRVPIDGLYRPFSTPLTPPPTTRPRNDNNYNNNIVVAKSRIDSGIFMDVEQTKPMLKKSPKKPIVSSTFCAKTEKMSVVSKWCNPMVKFWVCCLFLLFLGLIVVAFFMFFSNGRGSPESGSKSAPGLSTTPPPDSNYKKRCKWLSEAAEIIGQSSSTEDDDEEEDEDDDDDQEEDEEIEEEEEKNLNLAIDSIGSKLPPTLPPSTNLHLTIVNRKPNEGTDWWLRLLPPSATAHRVAKLILMGQFSSLELMHFCNLFPNVKAAYSLPGPSDFLPN